MGQLLLLHVWSLPFDLPEMTWWIWALMGLGGGFFAAAVGKFSDQYGLAGFLSVVIALLACGCAAVAIYELLSS
jgi:hypothetical protein